jgi:hypothetical protein
MTDLDADLINRHAHLARGFLGNDPDVEQDAGYQAVRALADEDVPALLLELERVTVGNDHAYVRGLQAAARTLAGFDRDDAPGIARSTARLLADTIARMAETAQHQFGVDGDGPAAEALSAFLAGSTFVGYQALHDVAERGNLRHALNQMILAADSVAQGHDKTDRPLTAQEQDEFEQQWAGRR